jgi:hypothetical protein
MARRNALIVAFALLGIGLGPHAGPASAADASVDVPDASGYFPNKPGEWQYVPQREDVREVGLGPAAARALIDKMEGIMAVLAEPAVFHPPIGFQARARTDYRGRICRSGEDLCSEGPASVYQAITFYYFMAQDDGKAHWGGEANSSAVLHINDTGHLYDLAPQREALLPDGRSIAALPAETGRFYGFPQYKRSRLILPRPGVPIWVPVSREQYLEALIRARDHEIAKLRSDQASVVDPYATWVAERAERAQSAEETYQALKKMDPVKAEEFRRMNEQMEAGIEAQLQAVRMPADDLGMLRTFETTTARLRDELASMSPRERASQGLWMKPEDDDLLGSGLVPAGTPGAVELVALNPKLVDRTRPPEEIQLITVETNFDGSRVSNARLQEFLETVDWRRVASFLR